jgi:hypothetical protein
MAMPDLLRNKHPETFAKIVRTSKSIVETIDENDMFACIVYEASSGKIVVASNADSNGELIEFVGAWLKMAKEEQAKASS